jgi:hypothetical protein
MENIILRIFIVRPYRCLDCDKRFYRYSGRPLKERFRAIVRFFGGRWKRTVASPQQ